jgi:hypothetical protein
MNDPTDHERDDLAGDLATVTDEEWRDAHLRLLRDIARQPHSVAAGRVLDEQFVYTWAPGRTPDVDIHERDEAPAPGQWIGRVPDGQ